MAMASVAINWNGEVLNCIQSTTDRRTLLFLSFSLFLIFSSDSHPDAAIVLPCHQTLQTHLYVTLILPPSPLRLSPVVFL